MKAIEMDRLITNASRQPLFGGE